MSSKEIDYYPEVVDQLSKYLKDFLPEGCTVIGLHNQMPRCADLSGMIRVINEELGLPEFQRYFPRIKIDILVCVATSENKVSFLMSEVKFDNPLRLMDLSQLIGYLQVSRLCTIGVLSLVSRKTVQPVSSDLQKVIDLSEMDLTWKVIGAAKREHSYSIAVMTFDIGGKAQIVDTANAYGLSSWRQIAERLIRSAQFLDE